MLKYFIVLGYLYTLKSMLFHLKKDIQSDSENNHKFHLKKMHKSQMRSSRLKPQNYFIFLAIYVSNT